MRPVKGRGHLAAFVAAPVAVVLALLILVLATRSPASDRVTQSPIVGQATPAVELRTLDGKPFSLDRYEGRWVLVNFFATWCTPCRQEHPELRRFAADHERTGDAAVVSVVFEDDPATVRRFFAENGGSWPVLDDADGKAVLAFGVVKVPESYLIDPDGVVQAKITGGVTAAGVESVMAELGAGGTRRGGG